MESCAKHFGCKPGIHITLHTWGQRMLMHVHVHCMMTAGGIDLKTCQWIDIPKGAPAVNPQELAARYAVTRLCAVTAVTLPSRESRAQLGEGERHSIA
ncbi:transposase [Pirellulaceae bacterium SH449]